MYRVRGEKMNKSVLDLKHIYKSYHKNNVLKDLNMTVYKNDIYGFIGENGAGKTTTLRLIMSMIKQNSGEVILFDDYEGKNKKFNYGRIGAIIENPAFYPYMSAYDNLKYYVKYKGIIDESIITDTLKIVGLKEVGNKKYKNFSLGMKQRLGLGLALLNKPDLLILDEPFNGLDPRGMVELRETLCDLNRKYGITVIISTHNLSELEQLSTRYGFIHKGCILQEISADELKEKCKRYIELEVSDIKSAVCILEQNLNLKNCVVANENKINIFEFENCEEISKCLSQNGIGIRKLQECKISLEEYFLGLIKERNK